MSHLSGLPQGISKGIYLAAEGLGCIIEDFLLGLIEVRTIKCQK